MLIIRIDLVELPFSICYKMKRGTVSQDEAKDTMKMSHLDLITLPFQICLLQTLARF